MLKRSYGYNTTPGGHSKNQTKDLCLLSIGRPFLFELVNPRKVYFSKEEMAEIQDQINTSTTDLFIRDLQMVSK